MNPFLLLCQNYHIDAKFIQEDHLKIKRTKTDLLFIDTWHIYPQLVQELHLHGEVARKFMMFHDTTLYARRGEDGSDRGLQDAIDEFLIKSNSWRVLETFTNNNGLTVLERI